jgi:hypothetical protein
MSLYNIKKVSGHKIDIASHRYNLVTEEEILGMRWLDLEKDDQRTMDTYMDTSSGMMDTYMGTYMETYYLWGLPPSHAHMRKSIWMPLILCPF